MEPPETLSARNPRDSPHQHPALGRDGQKRADAAVHMQPETFRGADVGNRLRIVDPDMRLRATVSPIRLAMEPPDTNVPLASAG